MIINLNSKELKELLPKSILDSDSLTKNDKTVLGVILKAYAVMAESVSSNGYVFLTNDALSKSCKLSKTSVIDSVRRLKTYDLISKEIGSPRSEGNKGLANRYTVNFENLQKPLKKVSFETLFSKFINTPTVEEKNEATDTPTVESESLDEFESPIGGITSEETSKMVTVDEAERHIRFKFQKLYGEGKSKREIKTILDNTVQDTYANGTKALKFEAVEGLYTLVNELVGSY